MQSRATIGFDIDGVILNYFEGIMDWALKRGERIGCEPHEVTCYSMKEAFPERSENEIMDLVHAFNSSPEFGCLRPYEDALETISSLVSGYPEVKLVAITSAGASEVTRCLRLQNLEAIPFSEVHVLPIGSSKREFFKLLPEGSLFVDDLPHHAIAADEEGLLSVLYRQPYNVSTDHPRAVSSWQELHQFIRSHLGSAPSFAS